MLKFDSWPPEAGKFNLDALTAQDVAQRPTDAALYTGMAGRIGVLLAANVPDAKLKGVLDLVQPLADEHWVGEDPAVIDAGRAFVVYAVDAARAYFDLVAQQGGKA